MCLCVQGAPFQDGPHTPNIRRKQEYWVDEPLSSHRPRPATRCAWGRDREIDSIGEFIPPPLDQPLVRPLKHPLHRSHRVLGAWAVADDGHDSGPPELEAMADQQGTSAPVAAAGVAGTLWPCLACRQARRRCKCYDAGARSAASGKGKLCGGTRMTAGSMEIWMGFVRTGLEGIVAPLRQRSAGSERPAPSAFHSNGGDIPTNSPCQSLTRVHPSTHTLGR